MSFSDLNLTAELLQALKTQNYTQPTPIQAQAIPLILAGNDFIGIAQTGTGKTAAFTLPLLQQLQKTPGSKGQARALILSPTRELAAQTFETLKQLGHGLNLSYGVIFGGVKEGPQIRKLQKGVDVLVATPGRFLDLYQRKYCPLNDVQYFVLDEADRMLDMGFLPQVKHILQALPQKRQTLLFSATLPKEIESLAQEFLKNPVRIEISPPATAATTVQQSVIFIPKGQKLTLLQHVLSQADCERAIIFSRTKFGAERIGKYLNKMDFPSLVLHGDKTQRKRQLALKNFQQGVIKALIATDIAARGIDVEDITHVINFEIPEASDSYIHRIGRTGRAGKSGIALSFCDRSEKPLLRAIESILKDPIPVVSAKKFWADFKPQEQPAPHSHKKSARKRTSHRRKHA